MILQRWCNYFAPCVQLDEIIHCERMGMQFVLRRQGPVECAVSFRIRGSLMRQTQKSVGPHPAAILTGSFQAVARCIERCWAARDGQRTTNRRSGRKPRRRRRWHER